jgi:hypothetical protein
VAGEADRLALGAEVGVALETAAGHVHPLAYAETLVVPAAVGAYRIAGSGRVVKAFVK